MAIVVSDTSPIRALAHVNGLPWLAKIFASVVVPPAVAHELANPPARKLPKVNLSAWPFISVQLPYDTGRVAELELRLDRGEAEAITLAEQIGAEAILIDE